VKDAVLILKQSRYDVMVIDSGCRGVVGPREIDGSVSAILINEAMRPGEVDVVETNDDARVVYAHGLRRLGTGKVQGGKDAIVVQETVVSRVQTFRAGNARRAVPPTIWAESLMPYPVVEVAPGKSILVTTPVALS